MDSSKQQYSTIRTEGALFPPDVLKKIAGQKVDGVGPSDYHLPEGYKTNEAIAQTWDLLKRHWRSFQDARSKLGDDETGTALTNERWLLPLFQQLGYGRLTTQASPVIEDRAYPIERFYQHTPIHLIGCNLTLDRRTKGARGAATASPHSMVQEFLNRSEGHLWAILSNGLQLRLLRDNIALSRQAFVEFDLESMMEGEVYADFALLWLLCHQSRLEADKPENCWLEKWSTLARDSGTRVLEDLRNGVARAIEILGSGFIGHPRNDELRRRLQDAGTLDKQDFYRQLLRIVYRLLFLFVAEDRELLHPPDADERAVELYRKYYSTNRLRMMADRLRGSKHGDLWHSLSMVFSSLGKNEGCKRLALPGLGSFLWSRNSVRDVAGPQEADDGQPNCELANDDLLAAIRALAYVEQDRILRTVDYRNLGSEELGSVYESLLELHPDLHVEARKFELRSAAGNERKTSGSYYTPDSLVQCLLDSALDPVVAEKLKGKRGKEAEQAVLSIKVCDPACGSGHFLIAAAHRLARHLARIRTGESEPSPDDHQMALRDVVGRCIYGVDINPMAVELCKVSLWLEAIEPGKPLSFLEHHVLCGNSLLGTTPKLLADGIPDSAFEAIEGDVKECVKTLKAANKKERREYRDEGGRQKTMFAEESFIELGNLPDEFNKLSTENDDTPEQLSRKEQQYAELVEGASYRNARLLADLWCAAFVWKKDKSELGKLCPTELTFRQFESNPASFSASQSKEVENLRGQYQFFHWHLAFPDVFRGSAQNEPAENKQCGWECGFDVVLGNPPWERVKLQEKEWFSERSPEIANAPNAATRKKLIQALLESNPGLFAELNESVRKAEGESLILRESGRYPLCGRGDINVYTVFAETMRQILNPTGRTGCVLPSGIATDDTTKFFFQDVIETRSLFSLFDFENRNAIFPGVHRSYKFCLFTASSGLRPVCAGPIFVFFAHQIEHISEPERRFSLSPEDIGLLSPNTRTCPIFRSRRAAQLAVSIRRRVGIWKRVEGENEYSPWNVAIRRVIDINLQAGILCDEESLGTRMELDNSGEFTSTDERFVRLYEGKMINLFNHRFADAYTVAVGQRSGRATEIESVELENHSRLAKSRYWVSSQNVTESLTSWDYYWLFSYMDVCSVTNERTVIGTIIPWCAPTFSLRVLAKTTAMPVDIGCLCSNFASFVFDFYVRQFVGGLHLSDYIMYQMPVLSPTSYLKPYFYLDSANVTLREWLLPRVLELTYTAWDLEPFARDCGYVGPPFRWDEERRFLLRAELDAAFFHLYLRANEQGDWVPARQADGCPYDESPEDLARLKASFPEPREAVSYIMDTFPIVRRKDEEKYNGDYRTKRVILEIYDAMQEAIRTGNPYQTRLDPPPGPPAVGLPVWKSGKPRPADWPPHIHPPKGVSESK
jgi:hypothetical protein